MMRIAVASDNGHVTQHFGHCEGFMIFDTEDNQIVSNETVPNPGHRPGFLPVFLHEKGVEVVVSGGMGAGAIDLFNEKGIETIVGATGSAEKAVALYLKGELKTTGLVCHDHAHHDTCGE